LTHATRRYRSTGNSHWKRQRNAVDLPEVGTVNVCLDVEQLDDGDDAQRRHDVVDEVAREHRQPVGRRLDAADELAVLGARRPLSDRQTDERTEQERHAERHHVREHEPVHHRIHHLQ